MVFCEKKPEAAKPKKPKAAKVERRRIATEDSVRSRRELLKIREALGELGVEGGEFGGGVALGVIGGKHFGFSLLGVAIIG